MLNTELKQLCNKFTNCHYLETYMSQNYVRNTCDRLNLLVDSIDYDRKFLNFKFIKSICWTFKFK